MKTRNYSLIVLFMITSLRFAHAQAQHFAGVYNVRQYGAVGNGVSLDSKAINKAIDAAAGAGGGTVFIPAGNYLSGSIHLKNNVSL